MQTPPFLSKRVMLITHDSFSDRNPVCGSLLSMCLLAFRAFFLQHVLTLWYLPVSTSLNGGFKERKRDEVTLQTIGRSKHSGLRIDRPQTCLMAFISCFILA
jgi:hypothetical protein